MKLQTSWSILRHYGYNEHLRIRDEFLVNNTIRELEREQQWENVEASPTTVAFLTKVFEQFRNRESGLLEHEG